MSNLPTPAPKRKVNHRKNPDLRIPSADSYLFWNELTDLCCVNLSRAPHIGAVRAVMGCPGFAHMFRVGCEVHLVDISTTQDMPTSENSSPLGTVVLLPPKAITLDFYYDALSWAMAHLLHAALMADQNTHIQVAGPSYIRVEYGLVGQPVRDTVLVTGPRRGGRYSPTYGPAVYPEVVLRMLFADARKVEVTSVVDGRKFAERRGAKHKVSKFVRIICDPRAVDTWSRVAREFSHPDADIYTKGKAVKGQDPALRAAELARLAQEAHDREYPEWDESDREQEIDDEVQRRLAAEMRKRGML